MWVCRYHELDVGGAVVHVWVNVMQQIQSGLLDMGAKWYFSENSDVFLSFQGMARLILMNS